MKQHKVGEIQDYLERRGIIVSETAITKAAITIATRWGGYAVFACEFDEIEEQMKQKGEKEK